MNAHLTVAETLTYTAELRMPRATTPEERVLRVDDVLHKVGAEPRGARHGGTQGGAETRGVRHPGEYGTPATVGGRARAGGGSEGRAEQR